jgi:hypothetical protein
MINAEDLKVGDLLWTYNVTSKSFEESVVLDIIEDFREDIYLYNGVKCTKHTLVFDKDVNSFQYAPFINRVLTVENRIERNIRFEEYSVKSEVYGFLLSTDNLLVVNNLVIYPI